MWSRNPNKVDRRSGDVSARDSGEERDLKTCTGDAKLDGYTKLAQRRRSSFSDEMVADYDESPTMGLPFSDY